jgi:hypothetical protein
MTGLLGVTPSKEWNGSTFSPPKVTALSPVPIVTWYTFPEYVSFGAVKAMVNLLIR